MSIIPADALIKRISRIALLACVLLLSACAQSPLREISRHAPEHWTSQMHTLAEQQHWQVSGKLGLRSPEQSFSASFRWQQQASNYAISLSGPFRLKHVSIEGDENRLIFHAPDRDPIESDDPESLFARELGWYFPLRQAPEWIKGIPVPDLAIDAIEFSDQQLSLLKQSGWTLHYSRFQPNESGLVLPGKIVLQRDDIRVTLILKQWSLEQS